MKNEKIARLSRVISGKKLTVHLFDQEDFDNSAPNKISISAGIDNEYSALVVQRQNADYVVIMLLTGEPIHNSKDIWASIKTAYFSEKDSESNREQASLYALKQLTELATSYQPNKAKLELDIFKFLYSYIADKHEQNRHMN